MTQKTQCTSGPWHYAPACRIPDDRKEGGFNVIDPPTVRDKTGAIIARVYAWGTKENPCSKLEKLAVAEANARLLAAAWDMQNALDAMIETYGDEAMPALYQAKDALAKAREAA